MNTPVELKINQFLEAISLSLNTRNWLSALALTLAMPDICGKLAYPELKNKSAARYTKWSDAFFIPKYASKIIIDGKPHQHLVSNDLYALRCSFLHAGESDTTQQRIKQVLNYVHFYAPVTGQEGHMNTIRDQLQVRVDIFCVDMIRSVLEWLKTIKDDDDINVRSENLLSINIGNVFNYKN